MSDKLPNAHLLTQCGTNYMTPKDMAQSSFAEPALLGCPFCGGEAEVERKGSARASMIIACTNCGGRMESGDVYGLTKPESWAWNRRHPNDPSSATGLSGKE